MLRNLPAGQLKVSANSGRFDKDPITRKFGGECGSFSICKPMASSVIEEHHTFKNKIF